MHRTLHRAALFCFVVWKKEENSRKEKENYGFRVGQTSSSLTKFIVNIIYVFK